MLYISCHTWQTGHGNREQRWEAWTRGASDHEVPCPVWKRARGRKEWVFSLFFHSLPMPLFSLLPKAAGNAVIPTSVSKGPAQFIVESTQRTVFLQPFPTVITNLWSGGCALQKGSLKSPAVRTQTNIPQKWNLSIRDFKNPSNSFWNDKRGNAYQMKHSNYMIKETFEQPNGLSGWFRHRDVSQMAYAFPSGIKVLPLLTLTSSETWGQVELRKLSPKLAFLM